jgi:hypothetical protein
MEDLQGHSLSYTLGTSRHPMAQVDFDKWHTGYLAILLREAQ